MVAERARGVEVAADEQVAVLAGDHRRADLVGQSVEAHEGLYVVAGPCGAGRDGGEDQRESGDGGGNKLGAGPGHGEETTFGSRRGHRTRCAEGSGDEPVGGRPDRRPWRRWSAL